MDRAACERMEAAAEKEKARYLVLTALRKAAVAKDAAALEGAIHTAGPVLGEDSECITLARDALKSINGQRQRIRIKIEGSG